MGLLRMAARTAVVAGTATAVSGRVARRQAARYDQQPEEEQYQAAPQQAPPPEPAPAPQQDESMAKLQELAQLHSQGVLSDDEFTAAKAKILGI
jgi:Short C-terminal domain